MPARLIAAPIGADASFLQGKKRAGIERAMGGAGKGFAVVASKVRNLATQADSLPTQVEEFLEGVRTA